MKNLFILLTALFIISCDKEIEKSLNYTNHDFTTDNSIRKLTNGMSLILDSNREILMNLTSKMYHDPEGKIFLSELINDNESLENRSDNDIINLLKKSGLINIDDLNKLCKNYPTLQIYLHNPTNSTPEKLFLEHKPEVYISPVEIEKVSPSEFKVEFYKEGKSGFYTTKKEQDYEVLVFQISENGISFKDLQAAKNYLKDNQGTIIKTSCNNYIFEYYYYSSKTADISRGPKLKDGKLESRTSCWREALGIPADAEEHLWQFYTFKDFEGCCWKGPGDFNVSVMFGKREGPTSAIGDGINRKFLIQTNEVKQYVTLDIPIIPWEKNEKNIYWQWLFKEEDSGASIDLNLSATLEYPAVAPTATTSGSPKFTTTGAFKFQIADKTDEVGSMYAVNFCHDFPYYTNNGRKGYPLITATQLTSEVRFVPALY